jgi:hypothetical protein
MRSKLGCSFCDADQEEVSGFSGFRHREMCAKSIL